MQMSGVSDLNPKTSSKSTAAVAISGDAVDIFLLWMQSLQNQMFRLMHPAPSESQLASTHIKKLEEYTLGETLNYCYQRMGYIDYSLNPHTKF
jgi:hypothetical protein